MSEPDSLFLLALERTLEPCQQPDRYIEVIESSTRIMLSFCLYVSYRLKISRTACMVPPILPSHRSYKSISLIVSFTQFYRRNMHMNAHNV